jgi:CO/xanthine dehydrogenase Mo-binding subunit
MVETYEPTGPYGMKGAGEVGINGALPAIANAVADACGIELTQAPLTAERIMEALRLRPCSGSGASA